MVSRDYQALIECNHGPIVDMAMKSEAVLSTHSHVGVSVSGGADSDIMVDLVERVKAVTSTDVSYVWFDTGLEYRATRRHISDLEDRYGISIEKRRAEMTVPVSCKSFGQPFMSKHISQLCERLQRHGFDWQDGTTDELIARYPRLNTGIKWWTNANTRTDEPGWFDIGRIKHLKEFMIENPPWFNISSKCCDYAKKHVSESYEKERGVDAMLVGVRKAEGGVRAAHNSCVTHTRGIDLYRPLFWLSNADRRRYVDMFGIHHSDCYEVWGFKRTGCSCCPFGRDLSNELSMLDRYEPNVARAARKVFADSYEYTRMFNEFRRKKKIAMEGQLALPI